ncbi:MAG: hypothetical protein JRJ84_14880 [Deltaproteobacteria bacterium]|nr:hypothetical protein [Deltaproteobacteria bacterium]
MHPLCLLIAALPFQPALAGEVADEVLALAPLRAHRMAVDPPSIPVAAYDRAAEGKRVAGVQFVEGVAAGQGWGVAVYDLPIEAVWWAVNSEDVHEDWLRVEVSQVVDGEAYRDGRAVFQYLPLPVVKDRWWVVRVQNNEDIRRASGGRMFEKVMEDATDPALIAGTPLAQRVERGRAVAWTRGSWLLIGLADGRTVAEYFVWSDPGGMIPARPASRFARGAIRDTLDAMGSLARSYPDATVVSTAE